MVDKKKGNVKFVRIKGKVVPIRTDKARAGARTRSGDTRTRRRRKKPEKKDFVTKFTESTGVKFGVGGGNILAGLGFGGSVASKKLLKTGVSGAMTAFGAADSKKFERMVRFAQKSGKISKKFEIIGLGLQAVGAAAGGIEAFLRR